MNQNLQAYSSYTIVGIQLTSFILPLIFDNINCKDKVFYNVYLITDLNP